MNSYYHLFFYIYLLCISFIYGDIIYKKNYLEKIEDFKILNLNDLINSPESSDTQQLPPYNNTVRYQIYRKNDSLVLYFIIISDQDRDAKILNGNNKTVYASTLEMGRLTLKNDFSTANIQISKKTENLTTKLNYDGRGAEFSDLKWFNGNLMTVDDKTGVIYKIIGDKLVVEGIMSDGKDSSLLYKGEWITVKDKIMYVGGYGKEYTTGDGTNITNENPFYINVFDRIMGKEIIWWGDNFKKVRESIGITFPAYMVNEAVQWSDVHKQWFFLPRKVSQNPYTDADAEKAGSNVLIRVNEDFTKFTNVTVGNLYPGIGFSSFQFVPGTDDQVIIALETKETDSDGVSSYIVVFKIDGKVLYGPRRIPGKFKMEGIEFLDWFKEFNLCKK
ncbi:Soluble calcium-activated nucleotidase 1 [Strongyloides ratti]|uniref:Soluble calcium-activated nucleotidase 1 n=1 Tax=Strongyloides ratti TaxID=34506 RepID=A0A090LRN6_STRRB|nr:Soluble calcium-activated nucleotidase 1 [Strongyloides ratti]CEF70842.1 Soluble calcium-activated nucleotidase 1 [Strongyloides ratti]